MDLRRLRAGDWIAALSGALLLASLFMPWYGDGMSGWQALAVIDIALALVAAVAVGLLVITVSQPVPAVPVALGAMVTLAGLIGLVLVLFRLAALPGDADGREWGLWLGLLGTIGISAGGWLSIRDERLSPPGRHMDLTGRPIPAPPELEALPAPRPE